jgi:DNA-binding transcriptional regulator GbsR (MarR family)
VERVLVPGERKEYFRSEKDVWTLARTVAKERRRKELDPLMKVLKKVSDVQLDGSEEAKELKRVTKDLKGFAEKAEGVLDTFAKSEESWFWNTVLKVLK